MKIVIINGMHRSGTMLLSRLINAFPDTYIIKDGMRMPTFYYQVESDRPFDDPGDCYKKHEIKLDFNRKVRNVDLLRVLLFEDLRGYKFPIGLHKAWYNHVANFRYGISYKEIYSQLFEIISELNNVSYVGAKVTHMGQYTQTILDTFPNMKWIDIIRDPKGWYCSAKVSHPQSILGSIRFWNRGLRLIAPVSDRHLVIQYENLIMNSVETLQKICDFLGNGFIVTEDWLKNHAKLTENDSTRWYPNPSYTKNGKKILDDQNQYKPTDYSFLDKTPVYRWKKKLSFLEKVIIRVFSGWL